MTKAEFENFEVSFIVRMVAENLGLDFHAKLNRSEKIKPLNSIEKVLKNIENVERSWKFQPDQKHSYGRKTANEVVGLWSVPKKSAQVLKKFANFLGAKKVLEIGTSAGYSTLHLAAGIKQFGGKVYTIEILRPKIDMAKRNFRESALDNIILLEGKAEHILKKWKFGKVDMVFLDADKGNYGKYFDLLMPIMKVGSIIVADNVNDYGHLMEDYLRKVSGTHFVKSHVDKRVKSYYLAQLDNGLLFTKKVSN